MSIVRTHTMPYWAALSHRRMHSGILGEARTHPNFKNVASVQWVRAHTDMFQLVGAELQHAKGNAMEDMLAKKAAREQMQ